MLTLPEEINAQLDRPKAHVIASVSVSDNDGYYPIPFSSKVISYQKVCEMARGYQQGSTDAFVSTHINASIGVDGLMINHRNYTHHIWTHIIAASFEVTRF